MAISNILFSDGISLNCYQFITFSSGINLKKWILFSFLRFHFLHCYCFFRISVCFLCVCSCYAEIMCVINKRFFSGRQRFLFFQSVFFFYLMFTVKQDVFFFNAIWGFVNKNFRFFVKMYRNKSQCAKIETIKNKKPFKI